MAQTSGRESFDVVIIVPLEEEFEVCLEYFGVLRDRSTDVEMRFELNGEGADLKILIVQQSDMGRSENLASTTSILAEFDVGMLVCLGIAAGISSDVNIGDVCYTGEVLDTVDNAKIKECESGLIDLALSSKRYASPRSISTAINLSKIDPATKPTYLAWQADCFEFARKEIPNSFSGKSKALETIVAPVARVGILACGMVSSSPAYNAKLVAMERKLLALETESGGMFSIASARSVSALTIRGISDYADGNKSKFERETNGKARLVAVRNAASFLQHQLTSARFIAQLKRLRNQSMSEGHQLQLLGPEPKDLLAAVLNELGVEIDAKLKELSPGYGLQERGYRLPVPRIKIYKEPNSGAAFSPSWGDPIEVRDALKASRVLLITLPREYPDHSLSWIIASDLLSAQISETQPLPIVVEASRLQRPRFGFGRFMSDDVTTLSKSAIVSPTFIIDECSFSSKTKVDFLLEQIAIFPDAYIIVVTREDANILLEGDFVDRSRAAMSRVCDVSFAEMTYFLQKKFEMPRSAAEVVANRLKDTFSNFNLSAHPSYVAGIPADILTALLEANKRAELIQLAVAGYLSFVVSDDTTHVRLSRTTRESFLSDLVYAIRVERRKFDNKSLIEFTVSFATRYDFAIKPIEFISSFIEFGILHFEDDGIVFTLPFMESYLVSRALSSRHEDAKEYYNVENELFDMQSFSIYAELGPSDLVVAAIGGALDESLVEMEAASSADHVLLGGELNPNRLFKSDRLSRLRKQVHEAADDVRGDRDKTHDKQKLLDVADRLKEELAIWKAKNQSAAAAKHNESLAGRAVRAWVLSVNLVGSGAERLTATEKRAFLTKIVRLTSLLLDKWTRENAGIDFSALKIRVLANSAIVDAVAKGTGKKDIEDAKKLIDALVDMLEFSALADPFSRLLYHLCETARERVLAQSLAKADVAEGIDKIVYGMWLTDLDPKRGKPALLSAIKDLPVAYFLRIFVSSHLVRRAFWNHWKKSDRLILLNLADEAIKKLNRRNDRSKIKSLMSGDGGHTANEG